MRMKLPKTIFYKIAYLESLLWILVALICMSGILQGTYSEWIKWVLCFFVLLSTVSNGYLLCNFPDIRVAYEIYRKQILGPGMIFKYIIQNIFYGIIWIMCLFIIIGYSITNIEHPTFHHPVLCACIFIAYITCAVYIIGINHYKSLRR